MDSVAGPCRRGLRRSGPDRRCPGRRRRPAAWTQARWPTGCGGGPISPAGNQQVKAA
ncbi:hypothetical protein ACQ4WX_07970 [Streptomyces lasalocidi]